MNAPPNDEKTEVAVLGAIVTAPSILARLVVDHGLRADDFYYPRHAALFDAASRLQQAGRPIDQLTLSAEAEGWSADAVAALPLGVPTLSNVVEYAQRVRLLSELRAKRDGALAILAGVQARDSRAISEAEGQLAGIGRKTTATSTPKQLEGMLVERLNAGAVEAFALPFSRLTDLTAGGLRRGEITLLGGWSSHGKSVFLDQILRGVAKTARTHLYINEMTREQRALRHVAGETGLDFASLLRGRLSGSEEHAKYLDAAENVPFGITDAAELGGDVETVAHHIRANRWDVVGVDILHLFDHDEERDLARISRTLNRVAKVAGCHVLATVHLNERRIVSAQRPRPTLGDIRGSGMLKNDADNVVFVFRDQTNDGTELLESGSIYVAKARNGTLGGVPVVFRGRRMRFELDGSLDPAGSGNNY